MTTQEKIEAIRQECIRILPEIANQPCNHKIFEDESGCPFGKHERECRLADVLSLFASLNAPTIEMSIIGTQNCAGLFVVDSKKEKTKNPRRMLWNLLKPLEEQEEPTISFIYELVK